MSDDDSWGIRPRLQNSTRQGKLIEPADLDPGAFDLSIFLKETNPVRAFSIGLDRGQWFKNSRVRFAPSRCPVRRIFDTIPAGRPRTSRPTPWISSHRSNQGTHIPSTGRLVENSRDQGDRSESKGKEHHLNGGVGSRKDQNVLVPPPWSIQPARSFWNSVRVATFRPSHEHGNSLRLIRFDVAPRHSQSRGEGG